MNSNRSTGKSVITGKIASEEQDLVSQRGMRAGDWKAFLQSAAKSIRVQNAPGLNFSTKQVINSSPTSQQYSFSTLVLGKLPAVDLISAAGAALFGLHLARNRPKAIRVPLKKKI